MTDRYFKNTFNKSEDTINSQSGTILPHIQDKLQLLLINLLKTINKSCINVEEEHDVSVYTGRSGLALLYFHLYKLYKDEKYIDLAADHISFCKHNLKKRRVTFLCGDAGILALAAVIYNDIPDHKHKVEKYIKRLVAMIPDVNDLNKNLPDEILYGRSGFLYALLFVNKHITEGIDESKIVSVWKSILKSGKRMAQQSPEPCPLMYEWHSKKYIGAAHGISGILHLLLQVETTETRSYLHSHVKPAIDYILNLQFPSGNFPSSLNNDKDRLIHWCHGAPGVIHLMMAAHKLFNENKYLKSAEKCCKVIWERGLLKKGYGLCHGPAGNAYAFLAMFQHTNETEYLVKAVHFALWCADYNTRPGVSIPDAPYSLFEGLCGTAYFISDVLNHDLAKFPAFCV